MQSPSAKSRRVLTKEQVMDIFRLSTVRSSDAKRPTATSVARKYSVSEKTIRDIWRGRTWHEETLPLDTDRPVKTKLKTGRPQGRKDSVPRKTRTVSTKSSGGQARFARDAPSDGSLSANESTGEREQNEEESIFVSTEVSESSAFTAHTGVRRNPNQASICGGSLRPTAAEHRISLKGPTMLFQPEAVRNFNHHHNFLGISQDALTNKVDRCDEPSSHRKRSEARLTGQQPPPSAQPFAIPPGPLTLHPQHYLPSLLTLSTTFVPPWNAMPLLLQQLAAQQQLVAHQQLLHPSSLADFLPAAAAGRSVSAHAPFNPPPWTSPSPAAPAFAVGGAAVLCPPQQCQHGIDPALEHASAYAPTAARWAAGQGPQSGVMGGPRGPPPGLPGLSAGGGYGAGADSDLLRQMLRGSLRPRDSSSRGPP